MITPTAAKAAHRAPTAASTTDVTVSGDWTFARSLFGDAMIETAVSETSTQRDTYLNVASKDTDAVRTHRVGGTDDFTIRATGWGSKNDLTTSTLRVSRAQAETLVASLTALLAASA